MYFDSFCNPHMYGIKGECHLGIVRIKNEIQKWDLAQDINLHGIKGEYVSTYTNLPLRVGISSRYEKDELLCVTPLYRILHQLSGACLGYSGGMGLTHDGHMSGSYPYTIVLTYVGAYFI